MGELVEFNENQWFRVGDDGVTVGVTEEAVSYIENLVRISLPDEEEILESEQVCGEIDTKDGATNLYSPFNGRVIEINDALIENPLLIYEDPQGDSWLFKLEASSEEVSGY